MGEFCKIIQGVSYDKSDIVSKTGNAIRIIRGGNIKDGVLSIFNDDTFVKDKYKNDLNNLMKNDIVIVSSTGSKEVIGKPAFCTENSYNNIQIGAFLRIIRLYNTQYFNYIKLIFLSNYYKAYIRALSVGTNINNIKNDYINNLPLPLPPLAEQQRIVEKIEELEPYIKRYEDYKDK